MSININTNHQKVDDKNPYFNTDKNVILRIFNELEKKHSRRNVRDAYLRLFSYLILSRSIAKNRTTFWSINAIDERTPDGIGRDAIKKAFEWLQSIELDDKPAVKKELGSSKPKYKLTLIDSIQMQTWIIDSNESWLYSLVNQAQNLHEYYLSCLFMIKTILKTDSSDIQYPNKTYSIGEIRRLQEFNNIVGKVDENTDVEISKFGINNITRLIQYGYLTFNIYVEETIIWTGIQGFESFNNFVSEHFNEQNIPLNLGNDLYKEAILLGTTFSIVPSKILIDDDLKSLFETDILDNLDELELIEPFPSFRQKEPLITDQSLSVQ